MTWWSEGAQKERISASWISFPIKDTTPTSSPASLSPRKQTLAHWLPCLMYLVCLPELLTLEWLQKISKLTIIAADNQADGCCYWCVLKKKEEKIPHRMTNQRVFKIRNGSHTWFLKGTARVESLNKLKLHIHWRELDHKMIYSLVFSHSLYLWSRCNFTGDKKDLLATRQQFSLRDNYITNV